jgi:RNA polymerase sigma-70 factor (sigma-E family)
VRASDRADFEEYARARSNELVRAAWLLTGDRHSADDLVQETLTRIYTRWSKVSRAENPAAYARTIMVRRYVDNKRVRSASERPMAELPDAGPGSEPDVALRQSLVAAVRQLSPLDRAVVVQRYLLDLDVSTVASDLRISNQAVRSRSSRALARIRGLLGEEFLTHHLTEERTR